MFEILGLIGFVMIITNSYLTENFRFLILKKNKFLGTFFSCPMCIGFWVGLLFSIFFKQKTVLEHLLFGFSISFLAYFIDVVFNFLGSIDDLLWRKKEKDPK